MTLQSLIRTEQPRDVDAVRRVNLAAFDTPQEADLVDALRIKLPSFISLIAEIGGDVVGHIFFSPVTVEPNQGESWPAIALGPMAVLPSHQNQGVGSTLLRKGLPRCRASGHDVVFVLGHPRFYPRFGFVPAPPLGFSCVWNVPDDVFMVAELAPAALARPAGLVRYHPLF